MFTSSHVGVHVGTKPRTHSSAVQRRLGIVSCVFGEGAETEVKAAWPELHHWGGTSQMASPHPYPA